MTRDATTLFERRRNGALMTLAVLLRGLIAVAGAAETESDLPRADIQGH